MSDTSADFKSRVAATIIIASLGVLYLWIATEGGWNPFIQTGIGYFYDSQFESFLIGRLDVPPNAIENEAYIHEGRSYGYFGPVPALLRAPFLLLFPVIKGKTAIVSCITAVLITLIFAGGILRLLFRALRTRGISIRRELPILCVWLLLLGLASSVPMILHPVNVFHEAIAWGAAFAVIALYYYIRYALQFETSMLLLGTAAAVVALFCRVTIGAPLLLYPAIVSIGAVLGRGPAKSLTNKGAASVLLLALSGVAMNLGFTYLKFGSINGLPLSKYYLFITRPGPFLTYTFKLRNVPHMLLNYFDPTQIEVRSRYPYFGLADCRLSDPMKVDVYCEPVASLSSFSTVLCVLAIIGLFLAFTNRVEFYRRYRLILLCTVAPILPLFAFHAITFRYMHDFFPLMVAAGGFAVCHLAVVLRGRLRTVVAALIILLGILNSFQALVLAIENQV